ncbi:hypothetical protein [Salinibaculum rarum]|jgi:hypothetical protein|uniref:hypothetical protein n=1 Tax=Salinibaculum rarum TaxID=3058903 RepID=UPI00265FB3CE|nr:hypothetical protein [Salinibaculum sp. KK48]
MSTESDPGALRSIAVTAEDVVTAAETNRTSERTAVLRVTPPFSGRMRARLHVCLDDTEEPAAIHIPPTQLLADETPAYPRPSATEDELRSDPDAEYTVERHREYHETAVREWREAVRNGIVESVTLETAAGPHEVTVHVLD